MSENRQSSMAPVIGDVYLMKFEGSGNEQSGWRPGVVFQNNVGNAHSPNVIALPLTSSIKKTNQPTHVVVLAADTGLRRDSMVLCENPEKMSKARIGKFLTRLPDEYNEENRSSEPACHSSYLVSERERSAGGMAGSSPAELLCCVRRFPCITKSERCGF